MTIDFGGLDVGLAVVVAPQGRILVAGRGGPIHSFCVARLLSNGALDTTFASTGKRLVDFGGGNFFVAMALRPDGRILLAGGGSDGGDVARLNKNGQLDTTFSGNGKLTFPPGDISMASSVLALPNGRLLVGGLGPGIANMKVARLNANGSLDPSFGTGGIATVDFSGGQESLLAMARQANGRILLAGRSATAGAVVARLRANGSPDLEFGFGGLRSVGDGTLRAVRVQPDGKIVLAGKLAPSEQMKIIRLNTNGSFDTGFGSAGTATVNVSGATELSGDAALQADGRIVVVGPNPDSPFAEGFGIARLNPDGTPDTTFGTAGKAAVEFGAQAHPFATALQPNGRIVVVGQRFDGGGGAFAVARLLG